MLRIFLTSEDHSTSNISLSSPPTWMGRENGLRRDLVEALNELNRIVSIPRGCIIEEPT